MLDIELEWPVAYSKDGSPAYECTKREIRQIGTKSEMRDPFKTEDLFLRFAALDGSPASCVQFASRWGLLRGFIAQPGPETIEPLSLWRQQIQQMNWTLNNLVAGSIGPGNTSLPLSALTVFLRYGHDLPTLILRPPTLVDGMFLQAAQFLCGGKKFAPCQHCGKRFEVGAGGKRKVAKFCSAECRNRFHYERRASK